MSLSSRWWRYITFTTVFVVSAMIVAAFFDNEFRAQNWDPQYMRDLVQRTIRFGGTFYENGVHNKGPLEPMVYRIAAAVTSWDGFWYAISLMIIVVSGVIAWAAGRTTVVFGGHRRLGVAVGIWVFFHFALGRADYAGVLYSRNMVAALLAGAWLVALSPRSWIAGRARWSAFVVGVLLGLSVQTLLVSVLAAFAVGLVAWTGIDNIDDDILYRRCRRTVVLTTLFVTLAAPAYYVLRGRFNEFWSGWWIYAKFLNTGTGRSLANQLVLGRDSILRYYRNWPVSLLVVIAFAVAMGGLWRSFDRRERVIHVSISLWFVGAWVELVMSQRYSSHYFSTLAVPTALMAATVIGHVYQILQRQRGDFRSVVAWPLVVALLAIATGGGSHFRNGLQTASSYSSVRQTALDREAAEPGKQRTVRATLDLVSKADDPLLAWTEFPWTYLNVRRVSATRFIWKSFMLGQIYLGRAGAQYVLPQTWQWFADDMREAQPAAFLEETALLMPEGTPFADYVTANFAKVYAGTDFNIYLRHDQAEAVLHGGSGDVLTPISPLGAGSHWTRGSARASLSADTTPSQDDVLQLSTALCTRISGTYAALPGADGSFLSFRFDSPNTPVENMRLNVVDGRVISGNDGTVFDSVNLDEATTETSGPAVPDLARHEFAIVVGSQSAALVIDGQIRAAVRLRDQTRLSLEVRQGGVNLTNLGVGAPPPDSGCGG